MDLNKFSKKSDKIANLYRAAFYLAKGSNKVALGFLHKSGVEFDNLDLTTKVKRTRKSKAAIEVETDPQEAIAIKA